MTQARQSDAGFTLIEALVAIVVLGLGAVSLLTAAEGYTGRISDVSDRVAARWVAENALAETRLGLPLSEDDAEMFGRRFDVARLVTETPDPDLAAVSLRVSLQDGGPLFTLDGFVPVDILP